MTSPAAPTDNALTDRPTGREAVRESILRAARDRFARCGSRTSLRSIADEAGVNVGLIHRHFGRKDDLIQEVIDGTLEASSRAVRAEAGPPSTTVRRMFLNSTEHTEFVRMIAWLALESGTDGESPLAAARSRTIAAVRGRCGDGDAPHTTDSPASDDADARLMTALTVLYGWSVFSREILSAFELPETRRKEFEERMGGLLADLTAPADPKAPEVQP